MPAHASGPSETSPGAHPGWRAVPWHQPLRWLEWGVLDLLRTPAASLLHGAVLVAAGWLIVALGWRSAALMAGAFSGFLLVAPVLALGLYELSRRGAAGDTPRLTDALAVWRRAGPAPWRIGAGLAVAGTVWVVLTLAVWWVAWRLAPEARNLGSVPMVHAAQNLGPQLGWRAFAQPEVWQAAMHGPSGMLALLWVVAGGLLAALVFAASAVSLPLLVGLDAQRTTPLGARDAVLLSIEAVARNPVAMALWALMVLLLTGLGIATGFGLVVIWPILGHATWHAARDIMVLSVKAPQVNGSSAHVP